MDSPHTSTSCRILTICSSLQTAVCFVQQIRTLSGSADESEQGKDTNSDVSNEKTIPWTISNKYYSAKVHFLARTIKGLAPFHLKDVPAVVFVWKKGDAYKHHIQRIARDRELNGSEPEVCLAVRIEINGQTEGGERGLEVEDEELDEEFEDSAEIDDFVSSKGFEFIDVPASASADEDGFSADAIPSLPRVLDALSTIMWPSMQASIKKQKRPRRKAQSTYDDTTLLDWAHNSFSQNDDDGINSGIDTEADLVAAQTPASRMVHQTRTRKDMEEFKRWLEEDDHHYGGTDEDHDKDDPWGHAASSKPGVMMSSPTSEEGESMSLHMKEDGFDDDFTVFVSAPAEDTISRVAPSLSLGAPTLKSNSFTDGVFPSSASFGDSTFESALDDVDTSFDSLAPPGRHSGVMYHSLGSASDLGEADEDLSAPPDDSDDGLPTRNEIEASARRIFGTLPSTSSSVSSTKAEDLEDVDLSEFDEGNPDFDLTHMVSAIQGMKDEISGIENEDERRKAAARVALGLAYGLDRY